VAAAEPGHADDRLVHMVGLLAAAEAMFPLALVVGWLRMRRRS
jgi:hypothetical protein